MKTRNKYNYTPEKGETYKSKSQTIPNQTYSIRELLQKHTRGIMPLVEHQPTWADNPDFDSPDLNEIANMDIVDKKNYALQHKQSIIDTVDTIKQKQADKKDQAQKQAQRDTNAEKLIAEQANTVNVSKNEAKEPTPPQPLPT